MRFLWVVVVWVFIGYWVVGGPWVDLYILFGDGHF